MSPLATPALGGRPEAAGHAWMVGRELSGGSGEASGMEVGLMRTC